MIQGAMEKEQGKRSGGGVGKIVLLAVLGWLIKWEPSPSGKELVSYIQDVTWSLTANSMTKSFFFFLPHRAACGILVPQPGIKPVPPALGAQGLNYLDCQGNPMSTS